MYPLKQTSRQRIRVLSPVDTVRLRPEAHGAPTDDAGAPTGIRWAPPRTDVERDQAWSAFSSAAQQVSTISRVTTYGSTLALGRRSSM